MFSVHRAAYYHTCANLLACAWALSMLSGEGCSEHFDMIRGWLPCRSSTSFPRGENRKKLEGKHLMEADFLAGVISPSKSLLPVGDGVFSGSKKYCLLCWEGGVPPEWATLRVNPCRKLTMPRAVSGVPALALAAFLCAYKNHSTSNI